MVNNVQNVSRKKKKLKLFDFCSGIGGFSLGLEATQRFETIAFCESDEFCQKVLKKHWPSVPIYPNLVELSQDEKTIQALPYADLYTAGVPCQPFSVAGEKLGEDDPRNLWPDTARLIRGLGVSVVFLENVSGPEFLRYYYNRIRPELVEMDFKVEEGLFSAAEVGAPHRRRRTFILAHSNAQRLQGDGWTWKKERPEGPQSIPLYPPGPKDKQGWTHLLSILPEAQSSWCRTLDGPAPEMDIRLRAVGNGVVPAVAARAFRVLSEKLKKQGNFLV